MTDKIVSLNAVTLLKELRDTTPITSQRKRIDEFLADMGDASTRKDAEATCAGIWKACENTSATHSLSETQAGTSPTDTLNLLPCPFCGLPPSYELLDANSPGGARHCIECTCSSEPMVIRDKIEEAISDWNTRIPVSGCEIPVVDEKELRKRIASELTRCTVDAESDDWSNQTHRACMMNAIILATRLYLREPKRELRPQYDYVPDGGTPSLVKEHEGLGRFRHHPDPAIDFCSEVDFLEGRVRNVQCGMDTKEDVAKEIFTAMKFRAGGDVRAIKAKDRLRDLESTLNSIEG